MHVVVHREGRGHPAHFLRHLIEMVVVMMLGMFAGGAIFVTATGIPTGDAIHKHSVAWVSMMAISMTAPMVAWMRYRRHPWRMGLEMAAAMIAPAIPLCILRVADVISGGICGAYCGLSLVAMLGVMVYRRDYYSQSRKPAQQAGFHLDGASRTRTGDLLGAIQEGTIGKPALGAGLAPFQSLKTTPPLSGGFWG